MRVGGLSVWKRFYYSYMEITIDGKRYQLVPIEPDVPIEEQKYQNALMKARRLRSEYSEYAAISEGDLTSRILEIDELSDEDYIIRQFSIWADWDKCYKAISCCKYNPYKSPEQLKKTVLDYIREVYRSETSMETGFFRISYSPEEVINGEHYPAQIKIMCIIESMDKDLGQVDRDYLLPTDD